LEFSHYGKKDRGKTCPRLLTESNREVRLWEVD
jgi:hypothetical protein